MGFQYRIFTPTTHPQQHYDLIDIYILKRGFIQMGIKIRNPSKEEYGWDMHQFECKLSSTPLNRFEQIPQKWDKFALKCRHKLKWSQKDEQHLMKKIKKLNKWISEALLEKKDQIILEIKEKDNRNLGNLIEEWCQRQIDEIFIVSKNKVKGREKEVGYLKIDQLLNPHTWYYQTKAVEHKSKDDLILKEGKNNSYPQLLQNLFLSSEQKIQKSEVESVQREQMVGMSKVQQ